MRRQLAAFDDDLPRRLETGCRDHQADHIKLFDCLCSVSEERNAQTGKREGVMDEIGVIRGWRQRGIASALITAAMRAFREEGLAYAKLGVDTENPTGALRLYENLGFYSARRSIAFHKELG